MENNKTTPSEAIQVLKEYNTAVTLLVLNCETLIKHNLVSEQMLSVFKSNVESVKSFMNNG